ADGLTRELRALLSKSSIQYVQTRPTPFEYRAGTPEMESYIQDVTRLFNVGKPFLQKWLRLPATYDDLCRQMSQELRAEDASAQGLFLTAWGEKGKYIL